MAKVSFYKLTNNDKNSLAIKEGQVIFTTDSKRLYLDSANNTRVEIASYNLTQDALDNHILTFTRPDGTTSSYTIPDHIYTGSGHIEIDENNVISLDDDTLDMLYGEGVINKTNIEYTTVDNAMANSPLEIELEPNISQATTEGRNKLKVSTLNEIKELNTTGTWDNNVYTLNNVKFTYNDDGSITTNGTASASAYFYLSKSGTNKTTLSSGTYYFNSFVIGNNTTWKMQFRDSEDVWNLYGTEVEKTYATDTDISALYIVIYSEANPNGTTFYPMISLTQGATYEKPTNGASPNPDYSQDIHIVSGDNTINIENNNLLKNKYETNSTNIYDDVLLIEANLKPNTTYTIQFTGINSNIIMPNENLFTSGNWYTIISGINTLTLTTKSEISKTKINQYTNGKGWRIFKNARAPSTANVFNNLQIEYGSTATTYKPHQEQSYQINLGDLEYCKIGDYKDEFMKPTGTNLFDESTMLPKTSINSSGETESYDYACGGSQYIPVIPNTQYTFSCSSAYQLRINKYQADKTHIERISQGNSTSFTFTTDNNCYFIRVSIYTGSGIITTQEFINGLHFWVNKSSITLNYEPYDTIKWYLKKNTGKVVLNGSENWNTTSSTIYNTVIDNIKTSTVYSYVPKLYSNRFIPVENKQIYNAGEVVQDGSGNPKLYFVVETTTLADFKTWLSTHNVIVYYQFATPTYILLNDTLQHQLDEISDHTYAYYPQSNISQINSDLPFLLNVKGYRYTLDGIHQAAQTAISNIHYIDTNEKGSGSGVAELDENGIILTSQMPSYVDDVLEFANSSAFPATGESGKIYVALDTNLTYRWSGTTYVEISQSLALGETSSTAYRGDRGKAAYEHAVTKKGSAFTSGMYKITTNDQGHVTAATAVAKADITGLGVPGTASNGVQVVGTDIQLTASAQDKLYGAATATSEGTNLTVNDTIEAPLELELEPNISQATTTGKNLLNPSDTFTENSTIFSIANVEPNKTYYCKAYNKSEQYTNTFGLRYKINGIWEAQNSVYLVQGVSLTTPANCTGIAFNGCSDTSKRVCQVELGDSPTTFEPYTNGASPNPDYPQTIHTISGDNEIKVDSGNVINVNGINSTISNITYIGNNDYLSIKGTASNNYSAMDIEIEEILSGSTIYLYSPDNIGTLTFYARQQDKSNIGQITNNGSLLLTANMKYLRVAIYDGTNHNDNIRIMISTMPITKYVAYQGIQTAKLNLPVENLFDKDNVVNVDNKILNDNGVEIDDDGGGYTKMYMPVNSNTQYTISGLPVRGTKRIYFFDSSKTFLSRTSGFSETSKTITTPNNCKYIDIQYVTIENDFNIYQVEIGNKIHSYTPYGTALEYCKIGDYKDEFIKTIGKNLFDKNTVTNNKLISDIGVIGDNNEWDLSDYIKVYPNKTYTFSRYDGNGQSFRIVEYTSDKTFIRRNTQGLLTTNTPYVLTTGNNTEYVRLNFDNTRNITLLQFEQNYYATEYEPYGNNLWYLKKNIGKVVLDGSENWENHLFGTNSYQLLNENIYDDSSNVMCLSDYFKGVSYNNRGTGDNVIYYVGSTGGKIIVIRNTSFVSVDDLKTWLLTHNATVYYALATPTYTLLNNTLQSQLEKIYNNLLSYQEQTNISQENNDLEFIIDETHFKNNSNGMYGATLAQIGKITSGLDTINGEEV